MTADFGGARAGITGDGRAEALARESLAAAEAKFGTSTPADWDEGCPNCVTPWKCNGPHVLTPAGPRPALIAAQREKGWVDFGPEDFCHRCGGRNVYSWHAPNDVWNATVGDRWDGIVCPQCFTDLARSAGVEPSVWTLADGDALAAEIERLRKRRDNAHREMLRARAEVKRKEEHLARTQQERNEARDVIAAVTAERDRARRALAELLDAVSPAIFKPGAEATFRAALSGGQS